MEDKHQTSVWLPADLYQWLRQTAFDRNVSQSQIVRELIENERADQLAADRARQEPVREQECW